MSEKIDEAIRLYLNGDLRSAKRIYKRLLKKDENNHNVLRLLGLLENKRGKKGSAKKLMEKAISLNPNIPAYYNNLGEIYRSEKKYDDAILNFRKAISINARYAQAYNNLGCALYENGKYEESVESFDSALLCSKNYAEAYSNRGNAQKQIGQFEEALESYSFAIQINPNWADPYNNRGIVLQDIGKKEEALDSYNRAIAINPDYSEAYSNRGNVLGEMDCLEEAVDSYEKAIQIAPEYSDAYSNLCEIYEKNNMVSEMGKVILRWQNCLSDDGSNIDYRKAQLSSRKKRFEDARNYLELVNPDRLSLKVQLGYSDLLAKTYDKLGLFSSAFVQFENTNNIVRQSPIFKKVDSKRYLDRILKSSIEWQGSEKTVWVDTPVLDDVHSPVFLVGFPRSGTTLLDTISMSHPEVVVVEEKPMVASMRSYLGGVTAPGHLAGLGDQEINKLRRVYFEELNSCVNPEDSHKLVIDKLPLNITDIGLICRVFPESKFILSLRHPYDCVLSCFMQNFRINDAMANFLTLNQSAKLYDAVMSLWDYYIDALDVEYFALKYEHLVQDMRGTVKPLLRFLGLEWDDNLLNYQQTAISRGKIDTPSYNQVTQTLYTQASGRWKNYQEQIKEIAPLLEPWAHKFGYSTDP